MVTAKAKPRVLVLTGFGINCDRETAHAFELAGAVAHQVHVSDLAERRDALDNYQIIAIPGGFSFGDDIASGRVLAVKLKVDGMMKHGDSGSIHNLLRRSHR